jgi:uncharacterized protein (DUF736 family)
LIAIEAAMVRPELDKETIMATIGTFTKSGDDFTGTVKTLALNVKAKIARAEKENDKAPDYRIFAGATEFGAAWKKTSGAGREYLSVKLDDPSFPAPIFASLVATEGGDSYALVWSRRTRYFLRDFRFGAFALSRGASSSGVTSSTGLTPSGLAR